MPVLLDTSPMSPAQRCQAMAQFLEGQAIPMQFGFDRPPELMETWVAAWELGRLHVLDGFGSAMQGVRGDREVRNTPSALIAVTFYQSGTTTGARGSEGFVAHPGDLLILDLTQPYAMSWPNGYRSFSIQILQEELGLPDWVIERAARNARFSPMYELVRQHVARSCAALPAIANDAAAGQVLGDVTVDLLRVLLASAGRSPQAAEVMDESLPLRIERYILHNLANPALTAERIAAAHFISVRKLYYLWSGHEQSLGEWILFQRLERARRELAAIRGSTIAVIARKWGFADATHFSRRFKEHFGVTPREWRAMSSTPGSLPLPLRDAVVTDGMAAGSQGQV